VWKLGLSGLLLCIVIGCEQALSPITPAESPEADGVERVSTGIKLENPYSVESMKRAYDTLVARGSLAKGVLAADDFQPTHHYIRFKPETMEEYTALKRNADLVLWDYPLDYRFPEGMASYCDPAIPAGKPNYLYTAVAIGRELPSINYEILADLILSPEDGSNVLAKSAAVSGYYDVLEHEALRITGNLPKRKQGLAKSLWLPSGKIEVWDNVLGRKVPVVNVNVRTRNWFKWWDGYTDINGNFSCPKDYNGDISYSLRWQYPDNRFDIRDGRAGQAFYNGPSQSTSSWRVVFNSGLNWYWANIFKAGAFYVGQEPYGLNDIPFNLISIMALDEKAIPTEQALYSTGNENVTIRRYNLDGDTLNSYDLFMNTTHELGHAHHDHIYDGLLFGASVDLNYAQAWAYAIGYFMTTAAYPNVSHGYEVTMQGWEFGVQHRLPLMIDMVDIFNQRSEDSDNLQDFISGYTVRQLETIVSQKDCKTIYDFANKIRALPLPTGMTNTILNDYFNQYYNISSPSYAETKRSGGFNFTKGQKIYSPNKRFFLVWKSDGNLVLTDTKSSPWRNVWTSKTSGRVTTHCIMQPDGNLVIYNMNNPSGSQAVWCTGTWNNPDAGLSVVDNGRVVIYNKYRKERWSSTNDTGMRF